MRLLALLIACTCLAALAGVPGDAAPASAPALALVIHLAPPRQSDASLAAAAVALRAPEELGEPLRALRAHPGAKLSIALTPRYLAALERSANGDTALRDAASISQRTSSSDEFIALLARHRPLNAAIGRSRAGSRYLTLAIAATNRLAGQTSTSFSGSELSDFASSAAQVALAASGYGPVPNDVAPESASLSSLARADREILDELKSGVRAGSVEILAVPDNEPVLPLIVDAGGKTSADANVVDAGTRADARWLLRDAMRADETLGERRPGVYSPYGAYDDAAAADIAGAGAAFALFSDRVVRGLGSHGTQAGVESAAGAALHGYALAVSAGASMPTYFWSQTASDELSAASGSQDAAARLLSALAHDAATIAVDRNPHVFIVRLESGDAWAQRSDAAAVVDRLVAEIASGRAGRPTTLGAFASAHRPSASAYGYPPNSEYGSFSLWMGSRNQASLWNALAQARQAAGGDAVLNKPNVRELVFDAESAGWYSMLAQPESPNRQLSQLEAFRRLIARIYEASGAHAPASIAPVKLAQPAPSGSASPAASTPAPPL